MSDTDEDFIDSLMELWQNCQWEDKYNEHAHQHRTEKMQLLLYMEIPL